MASSISVRAISDVLEYGRALLKFISPNNVGLTGSHECGYYLPKSAWGLYTPHPPKRGKNQEHFVEILWPDGRKTNSCIKWYGVRTRSEYRLTRFGKDFPWLTAGNIGDLLVLIPTGDTSFIAHVLDLEDDIEDLQAALGIEITGTWAIYDSTAPTEQLTEVECIDKHFRRFTKSLLEFPNTIAFSSETIKAFETCIRDFGQLSVDKKIMNLMDAEYKLFRIAERKLCQDQIARLFRSVDDFLETAATIMNRRKARAGRSLENHVEYVLRKEDIPFEVRPNIDGKPDIIIPSKMAYDDSIFPVDKLFMIGIKTTCKDRWRQVLNEAKRVKKKHILTLQRGISENQLLEMRNANVQLIVPKPLHKEFPPESSMPLLTVNEFVTKVKICLGQK